MPSNTATSVRPKLLHCRAGCLARRCPSSTPRHLRCTPLAAMRRPGASCCCAGACCALMFSVHLCSYPVCTGCTQSTHKMLARCCSQPWLIDGTHEQSFTPALGCSVHTGGAAVHAGVLPRPASGAAHHAGGRPAAAGRRADRPRALPVQQHQPRPHGDPKAS